MIILYLTHDHAAHLRLCLSWPQNVFSIVGEPAEVRVITEHNTEQSKGFGFVRYSNQAEAEAAVSELNRVEVCGKEVTVRLSGDKYTLFLGGIDKSLTCDDIIEALLSKAIDGLCDVTMQMDASNPGRWGQ